MIKYALAFILASSVAFAQLDIPAEARYQMVSVEFDTLTLDSIRLFTLPAGAQLEYIAIAIDSTIGGIDGDSIKIGIQGERPLSPFRFADFPYDSIPRGSMVRLSHYNFRQNVAGALYTYETDGVTATCEIAGVYYPVEGLSEFPYNDLKATTGGAMEVPPYRDGWYQMGLQSSFSSSKANVEMHGELFKNGDGYDYASFERTIATAGQVGSASFVGGVYLAESDTLKFYVKSNVANVIYSIQHCQFILVRQQDGVPYSTATDKQIWLYTTASDGDIRVFIKYRELF